ncbi:MAG: hypothetical protein A3J46_02360 [Candidatus Yanofskybacteria bacterium RIFCSPHIGHO2_02_FULL_41_11]|uniref:ATPase AAA-type core domain-containing protein n=1 Tax=Candidatus Yanofskybacteria bacterium RIFCSPHIGHO2_02_FULL_41_11 TaxID=1802675 RepID=A0A1F8FBF5_9BACT|nr:MAG: hypothetical protein A3J46_02360 [Candidatus Yanofskybacteria bacterium RIFCSPHIGHO2_02_FULL_41_11]
MINKFFIYGVPGSGKTYISQKLSKDLNLPLFEADTIKDELRQSTTKEESPFLFLGTSQAYRHFGELNQENIIKGLQAVRRSLSERVLKEVQSRNKVVMEGAFLDPNLLGDFGKLILVVTSDEKQHQNQFSHHREKTDESVNEFKAARIIQDFLISEAKDLGVEIKENE